MVYYRNSKFEISNTKVHYIDVDEGEVKKYVAEEGKQYWIDFAEMWADFKLLGFEDTEVTDEQLERLDIINELELKEGTSLVEKYVEYGDLSGVTRSHPLYMLVIEKDLNLMSDVIAETLSMMTGGAE